MGECGTSSSGDTILAGEHTSCGFAGAMFDAAMNTTFVLKGGPQTEPMYHTPGDIDVTYNGVTYKVSCLVGTPSNMSCTKQEGPSATAAFHYKGVGAGWPDVLQTQ
ncbi:hypothetical protein [Corynebacterium sp.]|uniref:hypothetical protein n=1 Tax=Corynebacterium sp. TaxID=1720 RepID=UPI0026DBD66B|nr:hypothetical protein [Corynebacterium sp.]MDO5031296.1 hypothetical protein [Corynebacterium sp.]